MTESPAQMLADHMRTDPLVTSMIDPDRIYPVGKSSYEFSVVWRWKTDRYRDEFSDERRRVYKTEAGARRLLAKLNKNDGKYEKHIELEPTTYDDGYRVEHWTLDYGYIERRAVGPWIALPRR